MKRYTREEIEEESRVIATLPITDRLRAIIRQLLADLDAKECHLHGEPIQCFKCAEVDRVVKQLKG